MEPLGSAESPCKAVIPIWRGTSHREEMNGGQPQREDCNFNIKNSDLKWVCNLEKHTGIESFASSKPASLGIEGPRGDPVAQFSAQTPDPRKPGAEAGGGGWGTWPLSGGVEGGAFCQVQESGLHP